MPFATQAAKRTTLTSPPQPCRHFYCCCCYCLTGGGEEGPHLTWCSLRVCVYSQFRHQRDAFAYEKNRQTTICLYIKCKIKFIKAKSSFEINKCKCFIELLLKTQHADRQASTAKSIYAMLHTMLSVYNITGQFAVCRFVKKLNNTRYCAFF